MPTMKRGASFKAGFLYGSALRRRRCRGRGCGRRPRRRDGPASGGGSRRPAARVVARLAGSGIGNPAGGPIRATKAARERAGIHRARTGPPFPPGAEAARGPASVRRNWCERGDSNPPRVAPLAPKTSASACSATFRARPAVPAFGSAGLQTPHSGIRRNRLHFFRRRKTAVRLLRIDELVAKGDLEHAARNSRPARSRRPQSGRTCPSHGGLPVRTLKHRRIRS